MFNNYPYTDAHELNLDFILRKIKEMRGELSEFEVLNTITVGGVWDITKNYAQYVIVDDGNGNGYVSIKPVPPGIDITNTEYWMLIAPYYSIIDDLAARVAALEAQTLTGDILIVFDSYGTTYGNPAGDNTTIPGVMQTLTSRNVRHFEASGSGFVRDTGNGTFYTNLVNWVAGETNLDQISEVIVAAGRNDWTAGKAELKLGMQNFYDYCDATFPNLKKKTFAYIANGDDNSVHGTKNQQFTCYNNFKALCDELVINWMPNVDCVLHDYRLLNADGVHPTVSGKTKLAYALIQGINDIYTWSEGNFNSNMTAVTGVTINPSQPALPIISNNNEVIVSGIQYIVCTLPAAISSSLQDEALFTLEPGFLNNPSGTLKLPFNISYVTTSNEIMPIGGDVYMYSDGKVHANIYAPAGIRANNVSQILLTGTGTVTIPAQIS